MSNGNYKRAFTSKEHLLSQLSIRQTNAFLKTHVTNKAFELDQENDIPRNYPIRYIKEVNFSEEFQSCKHKSSSNSTPPFITTNITSYISNSKRGKNNTALLNANSNYINLKSKNKNNVHSIGRLQRKISTKKSLKTISATILTNKTNKSSNYINTSKRTGHFKDEVILCIDGNNQIEFCNFSFSKNKNIYGSYFNINEININKIKYKETEAIHKLNSHNLPNNIIDYIEDQNSDVSLFNKPKFPIFEDISNILIDNKVNDNEELSISFLSSDTEEYVFKPIDNWNEDCFQNYKTNIKVKETDIATTLDKNFGFSLLQKESIHYNENNKYNQEVIDLLNKDSDEDSSFLESNSLNDTISYENGELELYINQDMKGDYFINNTICDNTNINIIDGFRNDHHINKDIEKELKNINTFRQTYKSNGLEDTKEGTLNRINTLSSKKIYRNSNSSQIYNKNNCGLNFSFGF